MSANQLCIYILDALILVSLSAALAGVVLVGVELHSPFMPRTVTFLTCMSAFWTLYFIWLRHLAAKHLDISD